MHEGQPGPPRGVVSFHRPVRSEVTPPAPDFKVGRLEGGAAGCERSAMVHFEPAYAAARPAAPARAGQRRLADVRPAAISIHSQATYAGHHATPR